MAIELCYMLCTTLIKISILLFYRRLTGSLTNRFVYWVWACITVCVLYFIAFIILIFFTCSMAVGRKDCAEEGAITVAVTVVSTVQDLVICLLPAFLIKNLQMPKRQKFALCGIFGLGLITTVCGIMRLYYSTYVYYCKLKTKRSWFAKLTGTIVTYDVTWYAYYGWIWTVLEADLGLICASAPALRVFFRHSLGLMSSRTGNSRTGPNKTPVGVLSNRADRSGPLVKSNRSDNAQTYGDNIYLDSIVVERGLSSQVHDRDDASQKSDSSTKNLTTIIHGPLSK
jgi:hypothetical protein